MFTSASRPALLALLLAAGCQTEESIEGEEYVVDLDADQPIDQLVVYDGRACAGCIAPLTPKMIAAGATDASGAIHAATGRVIALDQPTTHYQLEQRRPPASTGRSSS